MHIAIYIYTPLSQKSFCPVFILPASPTISSILFPSTQISNNVSSAPSNFIRDINWDKRQNRVSNRAMIIHMVTGWKGNIFHWFVHFRVDGTNESDINFSLRHSVKNMWLITQDEKIMTHEQWTTIVESNEPFSGSCDDGIYSEGQKKQNISWCRVLVCFNTSQSHINLSGDQILRHWYFKIAVMSGTQFYLMKSQEKVLYDGVLKYRAEAVCSKWIKKG